MNRDVAIVIFNYNKNNKREEVDLELSLDITANELFVALNSAYELGVDVSDIKSCYLKAENPVVLLKGNKTLREYGIRNGSIIHFNIEE